MQQGVWQGGCVCWPQLMCTINSIVQLLGQTGITSIYDYLSASIGVLGITTPKWELQFPKTRSLAEILAQSLNCACGLPAHSYS